MCDGEDSGLLGHVKEEVDQLAGRIVGATESEANPATPGGDSDLLGASVRRNVIEPAQIPDEMLARSVLGLTPVDYRSTTAYITKAMVNFISHWTQWMNADKEKLLKFCREGHNPWM